MPEEQLSYRFRFKIGDRVRMPNSRLGTIVDFDFPTAPNFLRLFVKPDKPNTGWRKWLPVFRRSYVEEEIDGLVLVDPKLDPDA